MNYLNVDYVRELVERRGYSYSDVSKECQRQRPGQKGCSARSIRRFCKMNNIFCRSNISDSNLDRLTALYISKVGHVYGRKMMYGLLKSEGWRVGENRIGRSMKRVHPLQLESRRKEANRHINPRPYVAHYFGHKLHVDQNEKIVMFGVVHILAVDGYSGKIVSLVSMPRKNCVLIYDHVFREIVSSHGLWQQLRVDHGTEWALMLYVQNSVSHLRNDPSTAPYLQTPSTQNHVVERVWVEVNSRVNYPIKGILIRMVEREEVNIHDCHHKYCISWFTINVCAAGLKMLVQAWNAHPLPKRINSVDRGTPNDRMMNNNRVAPINLDEIPTASDATNFYRQSGGTISEDYEFGTDPLKDNQEKRSLRQTAFFQRFHFQTIFNNAVNGDEHLFLQGLLFYIDLTHRLSL